VAGGAESEADGPTRAGDDSAQPAAQPELEVDDIPPAADAGGQPQGAEEPTVSTVPTTSTVSIAQIADQASAASEAATPRPTLSIAQIADQASAASEAATPPLIRVGYKLTIALLLLIVGVFLWVLVYAWVTQPPSLSRVKEFFPMDTAKAFDSYERLRTSWLTQIKDLLQLLVVSLLVPLVATVIGYIFGRKEAQGEEED
jgi:hypothetical protein